MVNRATRKVEVHLIKKVQQLKLRNFINKLPFSSPLFLLLLLPILMMSPYYFFERRITQPV